MHRDLAARNILLSEDGECKVAMVVIVILLRVLSYYNNYAPTMLVYSYTDAWVCNNMLTYLDH